MAGWVERVDLVERMLTSSEAVVAVVAPPGYGKSALLRQWRARRGGSVAWVACDKVRDDPAALWSAVATALSTLLGEAGAGSLDPHGDPSAQALREALAELPPFALALDQAEALTSRGSRKLVGALAAAVPRGSQLVVASRDELPFATARMRVHRRLLEIGATDLTMSPGEASQLLATTGVELTDEESERLVRETEGWPAGLYLSVLAIQEGRAPADGGIAGDDLLMSDYLRSEVLERMPPAQATFLVRTSVLDRVSGELAAAVTGQASAPRLLDQLHRRNAFVQPLDGRGEWYRFHPLMRQMLQATLRRDEPDLVATLHTRASQWFESTGDLEEAIDHAHLAGDAERFGRLVLEAMQGVWASGRMGTVRHWIERLGHRSPEAHTPAMIAHGALIFALLGQPGDAERWAAVAEALPSSGALADGSTVASTLAYLRANLARAGAAAMRQDARAALEGLSPASPYRATMVHTEGLSHLLDGDLDRADASFVRAYDLAIGFENSPVMALALTEQFLVAVERDDWSAADALVKRAVDALSGGRFDRYWTSALVYAAAAHAAVHRGNLTEARRHARQAALLRPVLTYALPVVSVQALLELARTYMALIDPAGVRAVLEQIRSILRQRPDLGTLVSTTRELDERVSQITLATPIGASSLTAAEIRLVPLLPTRLTYSEIGERLFISRHTVKTEATSVYRKLGASSRKEAVDRLVELGLL
jgi:LuxR family maltose regulon positive regulatory protein